jgi:hypothetical protein
MNRSKINQRRFWDKWEAAGAVSGLLSTKGNTSKVATQFKLPANDKIVTHESNFPIQPKDIKTTLGLHFFDAFDNSETEVSAKWLVRLAQEKGGWFPFTREEIEAFYNKGGHKGFWFNRLVEAERTRRNPWSEAYYDGGGWIIKEDDFYFFTDDFIKRCHKSSPVNPSAAEQITEPPAQWEQNKDVEKVSDLQSEMSNYNDVGVAMQVQSAIQEAIRRGIIHQQDALTNRALGEIRGMVYELNKNPDPMDLIFQVLAGKTSNPVEYALQFLEKRMQLI